MRSFRVWFVVAIWAGVVSGTSTVRGQSSYVPGTPTTSPWMNLEQQNTGPLDNYHMYVRPNLEMRNAVQQQNLALRRQAAAIQTLEENQYDAAPIVSGPGAGPHSTGTGGGHMYFSHYYTGLRQGRPPVARSVNAFQSAMPIRRPSALSSTTGR